MMKKKTLTDAYYEGYAEALRDLEELTKGDTNFTCDLELQGLIWSLREDVIGETEWKKLKR